MNNAGDKSFFHKLYIIIGLSSVIVAGLIYLIFSGGTERIQARNQKTASPTTEVADHTPKPTNIPSPSAVPSPSGEPVDVTSDDSLTRIVNRTHPINPSYAPSDLVVPDVAMNNTQMVRQEAAGPLKELFQAASDAGYSLYLISGYRSYAEQVSLYHTYVAEFGGEYTNRIDSHPGASEHQIGLAVDLGTTDHACELSSCFGDTGASQWLSENAWKYGWILRYPADKEEITGIMDSPWNYRYVGREEARKIHESGLTMEEFYGLSN